MRPLRGQTQSPEPPGLLRGVKLQRGPKSESWRVLGSGVYETPPSSPGSEEGMNAQIPSHAPLSSPQSPPAPPQLFPNSLPPLPLPL